MSVTAAAINWHHFSAPRNFFKPFFTPTRCSRALQRFFARRRAVARFCRICNFPIPLRLFFGRELSAGVCFRFPIFLHVKFRFFLGKISCGLIHKLQYSTKCWTSE